jgi:predicted Rossmann fold flavoprotein
VDTAVTADGHSFRENILFTHRGLSGPAILQASNYWHSDKPLEIDLAPDTDIAELLAANSHSKKLIVNFLSEILPHRLLETFALTGLPNKPIDQLNSKEIDLIGRSINDWQVRFKETEGWHKAEVTLGGVSTNELSSQTMESKKVPGLYFIGEVMDVTGWLGGYNFQWAWASGYAAGQAI